MTTFKMIRTGWAAATAAALAVSMAGLAAAESRTSASVVPAEPSVSVTSASGS